MAHP